MKSLILLLSLVAVPALANQFQTCQDSCQSSFNYCAMHVGQSEFGLQICIEAQNQCVQRCSAGVSQPVK